MHHLVRKLVRSLVPIDQPSVSTRPRGDTHVESGLYTNEEQLMRLIVQHDGSLWQSQIPEEMEWSASKTSRILCRMEERGKIRRRRIGREKVVFLPEDDSSQEQHRRSEVLNRVIK